MLAGLPKGPTYYSPDRHPDRAQERLAYVVARLQEDGDAGTLDAAKVPLPQMVAYDHPQQRDSGYYFLDHVTREARTIPGIGPLTAASTTVRTTLRPDLQRAAEEALQEGLAQYEMRSGRVEWHGPEANLADAVRRIDADGALATAAAAAEADTGLDLKPSIAGPDATRRCPPHAAGRQKTSIPASPPGWPAVRPASGGRLPFPRPPIRRPQRRRPRRRAAARAEARPSRTRSRMPRWTRNRTQSRLGSGHSNAARLPLYDVHWSTAIVLSTGGDRGLRVGLADGRILPLSGAGSAARRGLNLYDVVFVKVSGGKSRQARAELRVRPTVEGAIVVLDNKTGAHSRDGRAASPIR